MRNTKIASIPLIQAPYQLRQGERVSPAVHQIWQRLCRLTETMRRPRTVSTLLVGENVKDVDCPSATAILVRSGAGDRQDFIHANKVSFEQKPRSEVKTLMGITKPGVAMAGQSPQGLDLHERFLLQGLDSGKGLFQFVSQRTHHFSTGKTPRPNLKEMSVVDQLRETMNANKQNGIRTILGDRYAIISLDSLAGSGDDHCCFRLTIADQLDGNKQKTIPITQVGMSFANKFLDKKQIKRANNLLDAHLNLLDPGYPPIEQTDPIIVSYAGIGRNAALITYRETLSRIKQGLPLWKLNDTLVDVIGQGRRDRGVKFLHSEQQLGAVHEALVDAFKLRDPVVMPRLPRPPVSASIPGQKTPPDLSVPSLVSQAITTNNVIPVVADNSVPTVSVSLRDNILAFVGAHSDDNPLQFLEAMARKNIDAAAFCVVQDKRMHTVAPEMPLMGVFPQSMHQGIEVHPDGDDMTAKPTIWAARTSPQTGQDVNDGRDLCANQILLSDLACATQPQTAVRSNDTTQVKALFPDGLKNALRESRFEAYPNGNAPPLKMNQQELSDFVRERGTLSLEVIEDLAVNNPAAAVLFHFIDDALLCSDNNRPDRCERYAYRKDAGHDFNDAQPTALPTFLDGVTYDDGYWQIDGDPRKTHDKQVVVLAVIREAIKHLNCEEKTHPTMPFFPPIVYELLAQAINIPVPQYLKQHEQETEHVLANNRRMLDERRLQITQTQKQTSINLAAQEVVKQQAFIDNDVSNGLQLTLSRHSYPRALKDQSVDVVIPMPIDLNHLDTLEGLRQRLGETHTRMDISSKPHESYVGNDNLCWLRSTWLSVFSTASPEQLGALLPAIAGPIQENYVAQHDAPILQCIANLYREDPHAFMHWEKNRGNKVRIGPNLSLADVLKNQLPNGNDGYAMKRNAESFLRGLQMHIVAAFRTKGGSLMHELEALTVGSPPASSDLPVFLHRALNLPVLVIEAEQFVTEGEGGRQSNLGGQLRVAAPKDSSLAGWIEPLANDAEQGHEVSSRIMKAFDNQPVFWLENDHYDLYLPREKPLEHSDRSAD
jgi:hypothetical protein